MANRARSPPTMRPASGTWQRRPGRSSAWSTTRTPRNRWPGSRSAATLGPSANYFRVVDPVVRTATDARGRYQPYVITHKDVPDSPGLDAVKVDFPLKRGVWIGGKLTDKVTGKPVRGF